MKILTIADEESPFFYDYYTPGRLDEYDLILSCGDLKPRYLEFIATMASCPVLYVRGNHDDGFEKNPPGGCICIENKIYVHNGIRIMGLGGSYRYRDGKNMYTEKQMIRRIQRMSGWIWKYKGVDILLTHAPALGLNDTEHIAHKGFECFKKIMEKYRPKYFVHGHVHRNYGTDIPQICKYEDTIVINAYNYCVIEY
ncbi:MAG: metallophosphoesterase [Lachnospiraceae bacterium]